MSLVSRLTDYSRPRWMLLRPGIGKHGRQSQTLFPYYAGDAYDRAFGCGVPAHRLLDAARVRHQGQVVAIRWRGLRDAVVGSLDSAREVSLAMCRRTEKIFS